MKRAFDVLVAVLALGLIGWLLGLAALCARLDTGRSGIFRQRRIGRDGRIFTIYKLRTMRDLEGCQTTVTTMRDPRITRLGSFLRRWKIDELPQLVNVLMGDMSLVGPRPLVPTYLDRMRREAPLVLSVPPGITGPASLKYCDEEQRLAELRNPEAFNLEVIFPDKMRINESYVVNYRFKKDLKYLWLTIIAGQYGFEAPTAPKLEQLERQAA